MQDCSPPLFSVVIPTFNRAGFIARTIDSVRAQELGDYEVIVVDDGSTDLTNEILACYGDSISVFRQENAGPGAARNLGVHKAHGKYLVFLDSDDLWFPWTLSVYAEVARQHGNPALMAGQLLYFSDEHELKSLQRRTTRCRWYRDYFASSRHGLYCGSGQAAIRRDVLLASGGFSRQQTIAEDHDLMMRLGVVPGFVSIDAPIMIGYRQHPDAITRDVAKTYQGKAYLLQQEKAGRYPGGKRRQLDRRRILGGHLRPVSIDLLRSGQPGPAWKIYRDTFAWQLSLGRFKYLAGFPALAAMSARLPAIF